MLVRRFADYITIYGSIELRRTHWNNKRFSIILFNILQSEG
jgi:hypothetical protein